MPVVSPSQGSGTDLRDTPAPQAGNLSSASGTHLAEALMSLISEEQCLQPSVRALQCDARCVHVCPRVCAHQSQLAPPHLPACPRSSVWMGAAGRRCLWLAGLEPSPSLSVFLPHHSIDPPHSFCSCSVAVSTSPLGPFLCFLKGTWLLLSPCGTPSLSFSTPCISAPAGQGKHIVP